MAFMDRLEELKAQRIKINREIKKLESGVYTQCGKVKFDKEHYATDRPDDYVVSVAVSTDMYGRKNKSRWRSVIRSAESQEVIEAIPELIKDLQALYEKVKEGVDDGESGENGES